MAIADIAKNLLNRLNKTQDLLGDLDKSVLKLQTQTPLDPYKKRDIIELIKATNNNNKDNTVVNIMDDLTKDMLGAQPSSNRINMYNTMRDIRKKMPILARATRVWIDNILSPDDINKQSLRIVIKDETEIKKQEYTDLLREFKDCVQYLQLEKRIDPLLFAVFFEGDRFVEITTQDQMLATTIKANNITIKEDTKTNNGNNTLEINFIETPELYIDNDKVDLRIKEDSDSHINYTQIFLEADNEEEDKKDKEETDKDKKDDEEKDKEDKKEKKIDIKKEKKKKDKDDDKDEDDKDEEDSYFKPEVYDKIPDQTYDLRIAATKSDNIAIQDIVLKDIDPRNIIVLHKNKWVMGYLYVEKATTTLFAKQTQNKFPEEDHVSDTLLNKLYAQIKDYLSKKAVDEIPNDLKDIITNVIQNNPSKKINVRFIPVNNIQHFKYPSLENDPYGESYFADLLFMIKLYLARLTSSTLYRIARVGKHLVFYIDVTNTHDARKRIEAVKKAVKKREITEDSFGNIDAVPTIMSTFEDFYIPTRAGQRMVDIDTLELGNMQDVSEGDTFYLKNILTGIEIPPSYLGIEEFNSTKATLSQESMVFARSIIRMQKIFSEQLTELLQKVYRIIHGKHTNPLYLSLLCTFAPPSAINVENVSTYYNKVRSLFDDLKEMGIPDDYIRRRWLPEIEWDTIMLEELQRKKEGEEGSSGDLGFDNPFGGSSGSPAGGGEAGGDFGGFDMGDFGGGETGAGSTEPGGATPDFNISAEEGGA